MPQPWEKYQPAQAANPWEKYGGDGTRPAGLPEGVALPGVRNPEVSMKKAPTLGDDFDAGTQGAAPGDGMALGALKDIGAGGGDIIRAVRHPLDTIGGMASSPDAALAGLSHLAGDDTAMNKLKGAPKVSVARTLGQIGTGGILGEGLGSLSSELADMIPSKARAGATFEKLNTQLSNTPVKLSSTLQPLQRVAEIGERGSNLPTAASKLLTRSQSPIDMTFPEARDYQGSLSDLSGSDKLAMNGRMRGGVSQLNKAFFDDIQSAADQGGMGEDYAKAMKEYRQASTLGKIGENVKKYAVPTAAAALGAGELHRLLGTITGK